MSHVINNRFLLNRFLLGSLPLSWKDSVCHHTHTPGNAVGACLFIAIILETELKTLCVLSNRSTLGPMSSECQNDPDF